MNKIEKQGLHRFRQALNIDTAWPQSLEDLPEQDNNADKYSAPEEIQAEKALCSFQQLLESAYPAFHKAAERTVLGPYAVLYRWPGTKPVAEDQKKAVLFLAHYDVVPVDREHWSVDPFAAEQKDGFIYARGALDTKNTLISAMEAAEALVADGFTPEYDIWFAFGGDEERSGTKGARKAAAWFAERNISFAWTLDEGSIVADGLVGGVKTPLALVAIEEKGFMDVELIVSQSPGHASRPPKDQAAAILARALCRIEKKPFPYHLSPAADAFFKGIAAFSRGPRKLVLSNAAKLGPLFFPLAAGTPETAALLRTTVAMTQLFGSKADNILPAEVRAILNLRLLEPWDIDSAIAYIRKAVNDDRVQVRVSPYRYANGPIPAKKGSAEGRSPGWDLVSETITSVFPEAVVLPFLNTATTDSRHYADLCDAVYRFGPMKLDSKELARIHGHDERISTENFFRGIQFYKELMQRL